jgi:hypothetical protein
MIDYKLRKNSSLLIVVSNIEAKNTFLMQALKLSLQQSNVDLASISFGFYDKAIISDLHTAPINNVLAFMDKATYEVQKVMNKHIRIFPNLSTFALDTNLQTKL